MIDDPTRVYLREINGIPPLAEEEELDLSEHLLAKDELAQSAGERLVEANLAMVVSVAESYRRPSMHLLDLIQKGNEGLLWALKTFPEVQAATFSAYAEGCVKDAIEDAIGGGLRQ